MKNAQKRLPEASFELPNGLKVTLQPSSNMFERYNKDGPFEYVLDVEGPNFDKTERLRGRINIQFGAHGYMEQFRRFMVLTADYAKPFEVDGHGYNFSFKGTGASFYPPEGTKYTINGLTPEGFNIEFPSSAMRSVRLEFFPVKPAGELDF
jgi:hypothetical protein